jgi:hypothetical protein
VGGGAGPSYGNASIPTNGAANTGASGGASGVAQSCSVATQAPAAGSGGGATSARSGDVPLVTNSAAASGSSGAPVVSDAGGTATINVSVAGPTETFMLKFGNGAGVILSDIGGVSFAFLVAILLT